MHFKKLIFLKQLKYSEKENWNSIKPDLTFVTFIFYESSREIIYSLRSQFLSIF